MTLRDRSLRLLPICLLLAVACDDKKPADTKAAANTEPAKTEPAKTEPAKVEPAKVEPAKVEPAKPEPTTPTPPPVEPAKPAAAKTTPELEALDESLAAVLAVTDDDARWKAGCKALDTITTQIRAVDKHPPQGADAAKWTEIVESMDSGLNDFAIECAEDSSGNTEALEHAAKLRKELDALLPK